MSFNYDGSQRRGVTATCRRSDGREYEVAASEILVPKPTGGSRYLGAYRRWFGLVPYALDEKATRRTAISGERARSITLPNPVELIVLSVKQTTARCRPLQSNQTITLRAGRIWDVIPGEIAVVRPRKQWNYAGTAYLSGCVESTRIDASALGLVPLKLEDRGIWDPAEEYRGEQGEPIEKWAKPIIARGPRRQFEMQPWGPQFKGTFLMSPRGDIIKELQHGRREDLHKPQVPALHLHCPSARKPYAGDQGT